MENEYPLLSFVLHFENCGYKKIFLVLTLGFVGLLSSCDSSKKIENATPNLVIIFTDDQGYSDLSCFGGDHVYTPNIDQMAQEGAMLTNFYVAAPLCTPSRAALMTGCYPARVSMSPGSSLIVDLPNLPKGTRFPVCLAADGKGLNPDEVTIAEVAQSVGYKTGMFGKWHLGDQPNFLPTRQGFEEFFGLPYSHDIAPTHRRQEYYNFPPLPLLEGEEVIELNPDPNYLTKRITERAVKFIEENKKDNFLLYIPHPLPHGPWASSAEIKEEYENILKEGNKASSNIYATSIYKIDWSVGQILSALKEQGIDDNTIVLFTSDNGPTPKKFATTLLSGRKGQTLEGGMRMPTVVRWPNKISAGIEIDQLMTTIDILPTFANLIGADISDGLPVDGKDILSVILDGENSPHEYFFYCLRGVAEAVRWKDWKYRNHQGEKTLYNLKSDIGEKDNLIKDYPEIGKQLSQSMREFNENMIDQARPAGYVENPIALTIE